MKKNVRNILASRPGAQPTTVWLLGMVERQADRRLLGFIPLPDRYVWSIVTVEEVETKEDALTFDSRKRLQQERLGMENWLIEKCKTYKRRNCKLQL